MADILSEPVRDFPVGIVGRALVETFDADAASRTWQTAEGRAEFAAVARPGATFGGRPLAEAGKAIARAANSDLLPHHPLLRWYTLTRGTAPQTMDRVPRAVSLTHRSAEVTELMGAHGMTRQLAIPLSRPGRDASAVVVCRSCGDDFSDEDLEVATRIAPLFRALRTHVETLRGVPPGGPATGLSDRELSVLVLVARGCTSFAIASQLQCAPRTVEKHLEHVYRKLGVSDRVSAVRVARAMGILDPVAAAR
ncbi:helix-turn-helix transcriptional regulator [Microbacterium sp. NPDC019599]|uniref:helix-turn-helix transcriptional regulator n=1 Tax=Microbacterium sp. NPDC019599 TaxID=3154690 RepID=UPI003400879E